MLFCWLIDLLTDCYEEALFFLCHSSSYSQLVQHPTLSILYNQ